MNAILTAKELRYGGFGSTSTLEVEGNDPDRSSSRVHRGSTNFRRSSFWRWTRRVAEILAICCLFTLKISAQSGTAPDFANAPAFQVTGTAQLFGQYANRIGTYQTKPEQFWRMTLDPTLSIYSIPINFNVLLTNEAATFRQDISSAYALFSPENIKSILMQRAIALTSDFVADSGMDSALTLGKSYQDSLAKYDPEQLKKLEEYRKVKTLYDARGGEESAVFSALREFGFVSSIESVLLYLPTIGVGTVYPMYTPATLSGVAVTGGLVEWNPGAFYVAFTSGTTKNPVAAPNFSQSTFRQTLTAGRIGFGKKDQTHIYFTGMSAKDDVGSIGIDELDSNYLQNSPRSNYIGGIELNVATPEKIISFFSEFNTSVTSKDTRSLRYTDKETDSIGIPTTLSNLVDAGIGTFVDLMYFGKFGLQFSEIGSKFSAQYRYVGPGYITFGNPVYRNDLVRMEGRFDQQLFSRQVSLSLQYRKEFDNLIDWKTSRTTLSNYSAGINLNFRSLPYLSLQYTPYRQENDEANDTFKIRNDITLLTATLGYGYRLFESTHSTSVNFSRQESVGLFSFSDYQVSTFGFNHSTAFTIPLVVNFSVSTSNQSFSDSSVGAANLFFSDVSGTYTLFDVWSNTLGIQIGTEGANSSRTGFYFNTQFPVWQLGDMNIRTDITSFSSPHTFVGSNYSEVVIRAGLSKTF